MLRSRTRSISWGNQEKLWRIFLPSRLCIALSCLPSLAQHQEAGLSIPLQDRQRSLFPGRNPYRNSGILLPLTLRQESKILFLSLMSDWPESHGALSRIQVEGVPLRRIVQSPSQHLRSGLLYA